MNENFHPDFILWLLAGAQQEVLFVDPKGIRNLGSSDPKIRFCETIKEIETRLGAPDVRLHSFIISNTPSVTMERQWSMKKREMQERHVLFQEEDKDSYIGTMLSTLPCQPRKEEPDISPAVRHSPEMST